MRVLLVNSSWGWQEDEGREVEEQLLGLLSAAPPRASILGTNGRRVFTVESHDGELRTSDRGSWVRLLRTPPDVAFVPMILPPLQQLLIAALLRLRGAKVVCSTLGFLGRNFATASWFRDADRLGARIKPVKVALLRRCWGLVASQFLCASRDEVLQADLPFERCSLAPWPAPRSQMADAVRALGVAPDEGARPDERRPLALVSRFDPYRKGFDRIERWLEAYEDSVPRPAVRIFSPLPDGSCGLQELARRGLVEWDPDTRGEALTTALRSCSAAVLLSRWEGQPRALREAVLMGLPVLTTASANFTEVIHHLGSGAVVDGDDPEEIQAAFLEIGANSHSPSEARQLFDRDRIGAFLWQVFSTVWLQQTPPRSYYDTIPAG